MQRAGPHRRVRGAVRRQRTPRHGKTRRRLAGRSQRGRSENLVHGVQYPKPRGNHKQIASSCHGAAGVVADVRSAARWHACLRGTDEGSVEVSVQGCVISGGGIAVLSVARGQDGELMTHLFRARWCSVASYQTSIVGGSSSKHVWRREQDGDLDAGDAERNI